MKNYTLLQKAGLALVTIVSLATFSFAGLAAAEDKVMYPIDYVVPATCVPISHNLYYGQSDLFAKGDVSRLQNFLINNGFMTHGATGFYGSLTARAVARFQAANGISNTGTVGPITRGWLGKNCSVVQPNGAVTIYSITPTSGPTGTTVTVEGDGLSYTNNTINFGGGVISNIPAVATNMQCFTTPCPQQRLTFTVPTEIAPYCAPGMMCTMMMRVITPGVYPVSVTNTNGTSNSLNFTVTSGSSSSPVTIYSITPSSGPVGTTVSVTGFGFNSDNTITFGGMPISHVASSGGIAIACTTDPACIPGIRQTVTFTVPTSIGPVCTTGAPCPMYATRLVTPGVYPITVTNTNGTSNTVNFTVTSGTVNGNLSIQSVSPTAAPIGATITIMGTGFLQSDNSVLLNDNAINNVTAVSNANGTQSLTFTLPDYTGVYCLSNMACPMIAKQLTPGSYTLVVKNVNGTSNGVNFTITGGTTSSSISISGLDAPASLPFNASGTWTVHAASQNGGTLHYGVQWGDETVYASGNTIASPQMTYQTSASFTHSYARTGTYTPVFTVSDDYGHSATTSATVTITPYY